MLSEAQPPLQNMNIYTEVTPNPASLKFVVDRVILSGGAADFPDAASADSGSKLASKIFQHEFTRGVFFGRNFVTVTKDEKARWEDVIPAVKDEIRGFLQSGERVVETEDALIAYDDADETTRSIIQVIEEQVRPAVAMDGGDITFESFEDGVVRLKLRGSCSGCPSSLVTLKQGIQSMLTRLFPDQVKSVEAV